MFEVFFGVVGRRSSLKVVNFIFQCPAFDLNYAFLNGLIKIISFS